MGIIDNLTNALNTWNEKLSEIWQLITQSPENFKGGDIWDGHSNNQRCTQSNRTCPAGSVSLWRVLYGHAAAFRKLNARNML